VIELAAILLAQTEGGGGGGSGGAPAGPNLSSFLIPILLMFGVMWFLIIRPRQKEESAHRKLLEELRKGDRVYTYGGIIGKVVEVREREIVLKVDEGNGTRIHFIKGAVKAVLREDGERDEKDSREKDEAGKPEESAGKA
jgi:preprotein translocase subunit YajC